MLDPLSSCSLRSRLGIIMRAGIFLDARNHFLSDFLPNFSLPSSTFPSSLCFFLAAFLHCTQVTETLSCAGLSVSFGSKSREMNLEASTLARSGKSSTNVTSEASLEDTRVSERLYQLAETVGTSRTIPGTLGLWALVVDALTTMSRICPKVCAGHND